MKSDVENMYESSKKITSGLGATVWTVLEALRRGGASEEDLKKVSDLCNTHFAKMSDEDCNNLCAVLERRLAEDKVSENTWYS